MIGSLTNEEIEKILTENILGRLACSDDLQTYIIPVNYLYFENSILVHSRMGLKIEMMRRNPKVCFLVDEIEAMNKWKTVIIRGIYKEISDEMERYKAMNSFVEKLIHLKVSETALPPESSMRVHPRAPGNIKMVVYKIIPQEKTGRFEE
jgi:nitroimidazol reductase NimA-like FMN-containing flavoprotein (pyridoxamine 5'-phosphate oxidase superfamily)